MIIAAVKMHFGELQSENTYPVPIKWLTANIVLVLRGFRCRFSRVIV